MINFSALHNLRELEFKVLLEKFPLRRNSRLLEIGSGTGHQLKLLKDVVSECVGIDLEDGTYNSNSSGEIIKYDGITIPFENESFDYVFSSNTLEHVQELDSFEKEISRVLRGGGYALHVLPTSHWRILTILTHPIYMIKFLLSKLTRIQDQQITPPKETTTPTIQTNSLGFSQKLANFAIPKRHGERGNSVSEIYYFSEYFWKNHFKRSGWVVESVIPTHVAYSGNQVFSSIPITCRKMLSRVFGSSTKIYVLRKK